MACLTIDYTNNLRAQPWLFFVPAAAGSRALAGANGASEPHLDGDPPIFFRVTRNFFRIYSVSCDSNAAHLQNVRGNTHLTLF